MIFAVWCAAIVVKGAAACHMAINRLIRTLPLVWCYVACTFAYVTLLLAFRPFATLYLNAYSIILPFLLACECAAAAEIYWRLTRSHLNFRIAGTAIMCMLILLGAGAAWAISFLAVPVGSSLSASWLWYAALFVQRYVSAITLAVLLGALVLLPRSAAQPMPRLAVHAAWIMSLDAAMRFLGALFVRLYGFANPSASALVPTVLGTVAGFGWLTLRPYGDVTIRGLTPSDRLIENYRLGEFKVAHSALRDALSRFTRHF